MGIAASSKEARFERALPWIALSLSAIAWMSFEYGLAGVLRLACAAVGSWLGLSWGVVSILICLTAARVTWPLARRSTKGDPPVSPWLARVALLGSGIFGWAITLQIVAVLIVPSCQN